MSNPTSHDLNKCLADVAGVECEEVDSDDCPLSLWVVEYDKLRLKQQWTPTTDHNQMALVKAALREQGYRYEIEWEWGRSHKVTIRDKNEDVINIYRNPDELMAFALAVWEMKGEL